MCGLVGLICAFNSGFVESDVKAFEQMLYVDALRGDDATGVAAINNKYGATVLKEAAAAQWFMLDGEWNTLRNTLTTNGKALLGHNRKATIGGRKDEHAHPFMFDDRYIFFHNGTLHNHRALADTEVDSEALGQHVTACEGDLEKLGDLLAKVRGAYACVWYDADKHTVYLMRNSERPLNFIMFENGAIGYASETWMAWGPCTRNYMKVKETVSLKEGHLYSIDISQPKPDIKEELIPKKALPSVPRGKAYTSTGGTKLSKKELKNTLADLKSATYLAFFPDDVIPVHDVKGQPTDWLVTGSYEDWEGVTFQYMAKNLYKHEAEALLNGRLVYCTYDRHSLAAGNVVEVWVQNVTMSRAAPLVH